MKIYLLGISLFSLFTLFITGLSGTDGLRSIASEEQTTTKQENNRSIEADAPAIEVVEEKECPIYEDFNLTRYLISLGDDCVELSDDYISCVKESLSVLKDDYISLESEKSSSKIFDRVKRECETGLKEVVAEDKEAKYKLHSYFVFHTDQKYDNLLFGGLSGLSYNKNNQLISIVSDDFVKRGPPRIFQFKLAVKNKSAKIDFMNTIEIKDQNNRSFEYRGYSEGLDSEGIIELSENEFIISTETIINKSFFHNISDSRIVDNIQVDEKYQEHKVDIDTVYPVEEVTYEVLPPWACKVSYYIWDNKCKITKTGDKWFVTRKIDNYYNKRTDTYHGGGIEHNVGFEGLTITPDKDHVFAITERPLIQDEPGYDYTTNQASWSSDPQKQNLSRLSKFRRNGQEFESIGEFVYQSDERKGNGISDILALDEDNIIVMERGFNSNTRITTVKLYQINIKNAQNIQDVNSINDIENLELPKKTLLLDLKDLTAQMPAGFDSIDNFEGIALGPKLPNGNQTLILVTDNNFRTRQLSQLIIIEIK